MAFVTNCKNNQKIDKAYLNGVWKLTISAGNSLDTDEVKKLHADSGFVAGLNILGFVPENSYWNFVNDSTLILSFDNDMHLPPDTAIYHLNKSGDSLIVSDKSSKLEKYKFSKYFANQIKLDLSDNGMLCVLTKQNKLNNN